MASAGGAPWLVSMQTRQGGASAFLLHRAPAGLSQAARPSARFISILSLPRSRMPPNVVAIHSQDPDFYKIPYVEGVPVGKRLKLWNLPQNCKHSELLEWFAGVDVKVDSLEFTDDPVLNAQGIGGFVELATKQDACIAIVRLDGYKFRGNYIRLDFAEKRPHSRNYGSRRNRPNRSSSSSGSQGNFATPSRLSVTDMVPSYDGTTSANAQSTLRYEAANSSVVHAPSGYGSSMQSSGYGSSTQSSVNAPSTPRDEEAANSVVAHTTSGNGSTANAQLESSNEAAKFSTVQASPNYGSSTESSEFHLNGAGNSQGTPSNPGYGNAQSPAGYGSTLPSAGYGAGNSQGIPFNPGYGNAQFPAGGAQSRAGYGSASPSAGYDATQFPPGHGSAPSPSMSGGSSFISNPPPPANIQSAAPRYGNTPESGDEVNKTSDYHPLPSVAGYGSSQSPPSFGNSAKLGSSPQQKNDSTFGSPQQPPSQSGTELNGQSATVPSSPSYNNRSGAPLSRNRNTQPLYSDGTITGKSFKSGSGWAAQGTANYGLQSNHWSLDSQSISSHGNAGMESNSASTQSSFRSSQIPPVSSSSISSPGSVSIPAQPSYGEEGQPSASSSTQQAAPSSYNNTTRNPVVTDGHAPMHSPGPLNSSYAPVEPYEDPFENYGVPDAAVLEPWLHNTSFRSGPMYGSPQPSSLNRLFVGNLAVSIDDAALHELFSKFGTVLEARVVRDQESRRSRGFAVVAMASVDEMKAASKALDGWRVESRALRVDAVAFKH